MNIEKLVRPGILRMEPYSSARHEFKGVASVYLDANESPYGIYNRYPDPNQMGLKANISAVKSVASSNIFLGNGSDEILDLAFRIFCRPGIDKALSFFPSYGMYQVSAAINEVELIQLPLSSEFQIDQASLQPYLTDPTLKLILLCSPNNPTGNSLEGIGYLLQHFNGIVLVDEAYIDFSEKPSWVSRLHEYPNLIVLQTLSKAYGLAALRIGMAFASEQVLSYFYKVKPPYNISQVNQETALQALAEIEKITLQRKEIIEQRNFLKGQLLSLGMKVYPSDANFLLVEVADANSLYDSLVARGIIIRNRHSIIKNTLRITVGSPDENSQLLTALKQII
jgi:histidinol-phosphate aminotransferase